MRILFAFNFLIFFTLIGIGSSFAQEDSIKKTIFYFDSGKISSEGQMIKGQPEGYWVSYYENGNLQSEGNRQNGLLSGDWNFYTENGILKKSISYQNNLKNGYTLTYDSTGTIVLLEQYYLNDVLDSLQKEYYANGCLKSEVMFRSNKKVGIEKNYALDDGRLITENTFDEGFFKSTKEINRYDKDSLKTGFWAELYPNGKVKSEGYFKKGKPDGLVKNYNSKGAIDNLEQFKDGIIDENSEEVIMIQLHKEYHPNGKIRLEGGYTEGLKQGVFREFDLSGDTVVNSYTYDKDTLIAEGVLLKNGEYEGDWIYYYKSGVMKTKGSYVEGLREGTWIYYYESGKKEQEGKYKNNLANGIWIWYYENGSIKKQEYLKKGEPEGEYMEYDAEGNEIVSGSFFNGKPEGLWIYQYNDHYSKGEYSDGERNGKWLEVYLKTGITRFTGEYAYGEEKGRHRAYYPNGKLKYLGKYKSGRKNGVWRFYRDDGTTAAEVTYKFGKPIRIDGEDIKNDREIEKLLKEMEMK